MDWFVVCGGQQAQTERHWYPWTQPPAFLVSPVSYTHACILVFSPALVEGALGTDHGEAGVGAEPSIWEPAVVGEELGFVWH